MVLVLPPAQAIRPRRQLRVAPKPTDKVLEYAGGLKALVDLKSTLYLSGMELDYSDDLMNAGWIFKNPNAKTTCGCGTSFSA